MATAVQRAQTSALVGTWVFVLSDAIGFVALLSTLLALRSDSPSFASAGADLSMGLIATALLAGVSASMVLAKRAPRLWAAVALVLGIAFCGLLGAEYRALLGPHFALSSPGVEAFVVVTAYHGLHVAVGALLLLWAVLRNALHGTEIPLRPLAVYWHFVDALWLFVFGGFYLL